MSLRLNTRISTTHQLIRSRRLQINRRPLNRRRLLLITTQRIRRPLIRTQHTSTRITPMSFHRHLLSPHQRSTIRHSTNRINRTSITLSQLLRSRTRHLTILNRVNRTYISNTTSIQRINKPTNRLNLTHSITTVTTTRRTRHRFNTPQSRRTHSTRSLTPPSIRQRTISSLTKLIKIPSNPIPRTRRRLTSIKRTIKVTIHRITTSRITSSTLLNSLNTIRNKRNKPITSRHRTINRTPSLIRLITSSSLNSTLHLRLRRRIRRLNTIIFLRNNNKFIRSRRTRILNRHLNSLSRLLLTSTRLFSQNN